MKEKSWIEGPSLLIARANHSSCIIQSDDGTTYCIVIGGYTSKEGHFSKSTEIFNFNKQTWIEGPLLQCGVVFSACVSSPRTSNFACVHVGGYTEEKIYSQNVYGLTKDLSEWKLLGVIEKGRRGHIAVSLDYTI